MAKAPATVNAQTVAAMQGQVAMALPMDLATVHRAAVAARHAIPSAPTAALVRIVARVKTAAMAASANPARMPTWAACASVSRVPALRRRAGSPTHCAPALTPSVVVVAATVGAMATGVAVVAQAGETVRAGAARPIHCVPALAASAELGLRAWVASVSLLHNSTVTGKSPANEKCDQCHLSHLPAPVTMHGGIEGDALGQGIG